jgi:hypothetical protein
MKQLNTPKKKWSCGTIVVVVLMICGALYLVPQFWGGNIDDPTDVPDNGNANAQNSSDNINLGSLEISEQIDREGCATDSVLSLRNANVFYVIAPYSEFPEGTTVFARLYRNGTAIEDLPVITANQDYSNSCINFVFETTNGNNFQSGDYEVEFFVNGNSYDSISFSID